MSWPGPDTGLVTGSVAMKKAAISTPPPAICASRRAGVMFSPNSSMKAEKPAIVATGICQVMPPEISR